MAYQLQGDEFTVEGSTVTYNLPANRAYITAPNDATKITTVDSGVLDGTLSITNLPNLTELVAHTAQWYSLKLGSTSLTTLDIRAMKNAPALNLSVCPNLETVKFGGSDMNAVNVAGCAVLTDIVGNGCLNLVTLNLTGCTGLINCEMNHCENFTTIIGVADCENVDCFSFFSSGLTSFDATGCDIITYLDMDNSAALTSVNVASCPMLIELSVPGTLVTTIDVHDKTALTTLYTYDSPITSVNVAGCTSLNAVLLNDCSLNATALDTILANLVTNAVVGGTCDLGDSTGLAEPLYGNGIPSAAGLASKATLEDPEGLGWTVTVNEG